MLDIRSKAEWAQEKNAQRIKKVLEGNMTPNQKAVIEKLKKKNREVHR